jgi:hypothetical protein
MARKFQNILETVGNTPVVKINRLAPPDANLYVKIEAFNPLGSVKDRLALGVIEEAGRSGQLKPGQTVIEATSGNTGIGLAMVCAQKGYPLVVTMAETFSVERRRPCGSWARQGGADASSATGHGHGGEGCGASHDPWLVPDTSVRKRGQSRHALADHRARNHHGFCRWAALGHRIRHRRHAQGGRARPEEGTP